MLRGPVQTSFPLLDALPREAGTSGHVYPFSARAASPSASQAEPGLRLPSSIASATFWRSPYSEALRQSRTSAPGKGPESPHPHSSRDKDPAPRASGGPDTAEDKKTAPAGEGGKKATHRSSTAAGDASKNPSATDGKDPAAVSELSGDNASLQLRSILCKSSLSSSSRQSGAVKVQKRVKFEDTVDRSQSSRQSQSASCGRSPPRQEVQPSAQRTLSASVTTKSTVRMPSLRPPPAERQAEEKSTASQQSPSPSPTLPNPHHYPHIPRSNAGSLVCMSGVSDLGLGPRTVSKGATPNSYQLGSHSVYSCASPAPGSTSSRLSPTALDFKVYRQPPVSPGTGGRSTEGGGLAQSPPLQRKGRFFANPGHHNSSTRTLVRLSRSFTSPAITLPRPVKRPIPSSSSNDDLPFTHPTSRTGACPDGWEKAVTARDVMRAFQSEEESVGRRESFLDDDKTVQILHWLQEVGHRQAREGRCPVFVSAAYRDG